MGRSPSASDKVSAARPFLYLLWVFGSRSIRVVIGRYVRFINITQVASYSLAAL